MEDPVDQVVPEVQLVPLDLEAQPARSALVCLLVLRHPEHPEVRKRNKSGFFMFLCWTSEQGPQKWVSVQKDDVDLRN